MFNEYPYVNLQDVNLDWILKHIKDLETNLKDFVKLNTIKYADPIIWNITTQYETNTVVIDGNTGTAYLSVQPVPAGVALTNTDYWTVIFTLNLTTSNQNITFRDDGTNVVATFASDTGDWLLWNFYLYRVTQPIAINTAYVVGFNLERFSVELFIKDYCNTLAGMIGDLDNLNTSDKDSAVDAINEVLGSLGDLNDLNTTDKDSAVDAINEVLGNVGDLNDLNTTDKDSTVDAINEVLGNVGDLNDLNTTDKDSTVDAINEVVNKIDEMNFFVTPQMFGAIGDGVTDDSTAFNSMFASAKLIYIPVGNYLLNSSVSIGSDTKVICAGTLIDGRTTDETTVIGILDINNKDNVILDGITITASGASPVFTRGAEIAIRNNSKHITVKNCYIEDVPFTYAIAAYQTCSDVLIDNCVINKFSYGAICNVNGCDHFTVSNCKIYCELSYTATGLLYPISLGLYDSEHVGTLHIAVDGKALNNYIKTVNPIWESIESHGTTKAVITGNVIENVYCGIAMVGGATVDGVTLTCEDVTISNNVIVGATTGSEIAQNNAGIIVKKTNNATITGNTISDFAKLTTATIKDSVRIDECENIIFSNNTLKHCGRDNVTFGLYIGSSSEVSITNNNFVDSNNLHVIRSNISNDNIFITGNKVSNFASNYFFSASAGDSYGYIHISDNVSDIKGSDPNKCKPQWCSQGALGNVINGHVGDIIENLNPASGSTPCWICTVAQNGTTPATYRPFAYIL